MSNGVQQQGGPANGPATPALSLPLVVLPSGDETITACGNRLFALIAPSRTLFIRGGAVVRLTPTANGTPALDILRPAEARSLLEKFARLLAWRTGQKGKPVLKPAICPHDMAGALLETDAAKKLLPHVTGLINCPIIRERDGVLEIAGTGYDPHTGLLITGGELPPQVDLAEAVESLAKLHADFDFQSDADRSRAIASMVAPALKAGGLIAGRLPADVAEADKSQSGKTYRQKVIAAAYGEKVALVSNRQGGVGSVDETFDQKLIEGRPFIQFDNFRGRFASQHLEAFLTAEREFSCRVPHRAHVMVDPERFFVMLSSNGVDTTRDFANRSNIIRIRKRPAGYAFHKYPEGDLLAHVSGNQSYYLGCVFAVVREWHARGKPRTSETRHDFREWVQVLDWIVQNIFKAAPLMDGHLEAQERVSNPALVFVRALALVADEHGQLDCELTATELHNLCEEASVAIPGLHAGADELKACRAIGRIMGKLFNGNEILTLDGYQIKRGAKSVTRDGGGSYVLNTYTSR